MYCQSCSVFDENIIMAQFLFPSAFLYKLRLLSSNAKKFLQEFITFGENLYEYNTTYIVSDSEHAKGGLRRTLAYGK